MSRFKDFKIWLRETSKEVFFRTYPFDGYDPITNSYIDSNGLHMPGLPVASFSLIIITFLGFPSRVKAPGQLTVGQLIKNFFGGQFHIRTNTLFETLISIIIIICKAVFIFPLKLITQPFKLFINVIKLFTELIPLGFTHIFEAIGATIIQKAAIIKDDLSFNRVAFWKGFILVPILFLISCVSFLISVAFKSIFSIGRTLTSPLISARLAFNTGRELDSQKYSWRRPLSYVVGFIFALFSIAITALFWLIFLPLFISALTYYIPTLGQALTWFAHLPMVNSAVGYIQTVINQIPSVATFISTLTTEAGITFISAVLYLGTPLIVVIGTLCSFVADKFSNWWVTSSRKKQLDDRPSYGAFSAERVVDNIRGQGREIAHLVSNNPEVLDALSEMGDFSLLQQGVEVRSVAPRTYEIRQGGEDIALLEIDGQGSVPPALLNELVRRTLIIRANHLRSSVNAPSALNILQRANEDEYNAEAQLFLVDRRANSAQMAVERRTLSGRQNPAGRQPSEPTQPGTGALAAQTYPPALPEQGPPSYQDPPPTQPTESTASGGFTFDEPKPFDYPSANNTRQ